MLAVVRGGALNVGAAAKPTFAKTVSTAQFVTEFTAPLTATQYVAASAVETFARFNVGLVSPGSGTPPLLQAKLNGPVPPGAVVNVTLAPGHTVRLAGTMAVV